MSHFLVTLLTAVMCLVHGNACVANIGDPVQQVDDYQGGDGMGSVQVGDIRFETKSPDGLWKAYDIRLEDGNDAVMLEGPNAFKKQLSEGGSLWPVSFSPDSQLFVYVDDSQSDPDGELSTYVYYVDSGKIDEFTKMEPDGLKWSNHTMMFDNRGDNGFEHVTINIDTKGMTRTPLPTYNPN